MHNTERGREGGWRVFKVHTHVHTYMYIIQPAPEKKVASPPFVETKYIINHFSPLRHERSFSNTEGATKKKTYSAPSKELIKSYFPPMYMRWMKKEKGKEKKKERKKPSAVVPRSALADEWEKIQRQGLERGTPGLGEEYEGGWRIKYGGFFII